MNESKARELFEDVRKLHSPDRPTVTSELAPSELQAQSARCSVAVCSALRWAVYPCGYKWEIGPYYNRDEEPPSAVFRVKAHAEDFCARKWPSTGEVRELPNVASQTAATNHSKSQP